MGQQHVRIGVGLTGSFCTFDTIFDCLAQIKANYEGLQLRFVLSYHTQQLHNRFTTPNEVLSRITKLTDHAPIMDIPTAEPLGPNNDLDLFVIAPCSGNTLAKLANGITDGPVLMAAKGHLRNNKPLLIFLSSNDALGLNLKNVGTLLGTKHIFFVPFGQDAPLKKPNSLVAREKLLADAMQAALKGQQLQPLLVPSQLPA